jgi:hypothetical protein
LDRALAALGSASSLPYGHCRWLAESERRAYFRAWLAKALAEGDSLLAAREDGCVVGLLLLRRLEWDSRLFGRPLGQLDGPWLSPGASSPALVRRHLLGLGLDLAREASISHLSTRTRSGDTDTCHLLEDLGFRLMDSIVTLAAMPSEIRARRPASPWSYRMAERGDEERLLELIRGCFSAFPNRFHLDPSLSGKALERFEAWMMAYLEGRGGLLLALDGDEIVAFHSWREDPLSGRVLGQRIAHNELGGVAPGHRGEGILTAINVEALERLRGEIHYVETPVHVENGFASSGLIEAGFRPVTGTVTFHLNLGEESDSA